MNSEQLPPPPIIDSARILCYAVNDDEVLFTGRIHLFVNSERLGEVPCLAICQNYCKPADVLLVFCDSKWNSQGVIAFDSIDAAKAKAETGYQGISRKWVNAEASKEELDAFLRNVYEVDPDTEWWKSFCSFCRKEGSEVMRMFASKDAKICDECVKEFYKWITEENNS